MSIKITKDNYKKVLDLITIIESNGSFKYILTPPILEFTQLNKDTKFINDFFDKLHNKKLDLFVKNADIWTSSKANVIKNYKKINDPKKLKEKMIKDKIIGPSIKLTPDEYSASIILMPFFA
jgi:hypothetical protein